MSQTRAQLEAWRQQNPGLFRGLQQALSRAEGTWRANQPGYNVLFGGGTFGDYSRHPDKVIKSPGGYSSAAAGAYQFLPGTYQEAARVLGLKDFSPESQDLAMLYKVRQRLMPAGGLAALTKEGKFTPALQAYLAPEWASLPTVEGTSYYGQPVKRASQISAWFDEGARNAKQQPQTSQTASSKDSSLNLLNKFIDLLGITGSMQRFGPQSSSVRPALTDYAESTSSVDPGAELLFDLYKNDRQSEKIKELAEAEAAVQLRRNQAAMEQAKTQLLAQAISSFGEPVKLIS